MARLHLKACRSAWKPSGNFLVLDEVVSFPFAMDYFIRMWKEEYRKRPLYWDAFNEYIITGNFPNKEWWEERLNLPRNKQVILVGRTDPEEVWLHVLTKPHLQEWMKYEKSLHPFFKRVIVHPLTWSTHEQAH